MHTTTHSETLQSVIIVAVVVLIIARRLRGRRVHGGRQPIVIAIMVFYGGVLIQQALNVSHPAHLTGGDWALLGTSAAISLAMGAIRGTTTRLFRRDGELCSRYTAVTVALWLVTVAIRLGIDAGSSHFGASHPVAQASLVMMFGLSLAGETIVVRARAERDPAGPAGALV